MPARRPSLRPVPELLEVETYRRQAEAVVGRTIGAVDAPDAWFVKGGEPAELVAALTGRTVMAVRRRLGKLLVLDLDDGTRLGLRFGMTGRLLVDGAASIDRLEYSSARDEPAWDRFALRFTERDRAAAARPAAAGRRRPRSRRGPARRRCPVGRARRLDAALGASTAPLKARLLDQARIAGIGNLLADEILWRAGLDPARPAGGSGGRRVAGCHGADPGRAGRPGGEGGSHTGDVRQAAALDGLCPRDGAPLVRRTVGGRTTVSCPVHQR